MQAEKQHVQQNTYIYFHVYTYTKIHTHTYIYAQKKYIKC